MVKIIEVREIPLGDLVIGQGQARTRDVAAGIAELADSIRKIGLLEPIVVCESDKPGKYEILTGQRRFLACLEIGLDTISSAILDQRVDEITAKIISVTENLVRRDLNLRDRIDACTYLYKRYGSSKAVAEETGLDLEDVRRYVKYDRLLPIMKKLVDSGEVDLKIALRAQDAASETGDDIESSAVALAKEMQPMTGAQQKKLAKVVKKSPGKALEDVIEEAKTGANITQIVVTIGMDLHNSLQQFAVDEGSTQDDAAGSLIEEGLGQKGYIK